ncbi:MAG: glutaredoxin 3 [Pseudohongiellaceae bacterium]|jgi:glutaredoxin 3
MAEIIIYTRQFCGYCTAAVALLTSKGYQFIEMATDGDQQMRTEIAQRSGQTTVPQIFVDDFSLGGYTELARAIADGEFDKRLNSQAS